MLTVTFKPIKSELGDILGGPSQYIITWPQSPYLNINCGQPKRLLGVQFFGRNGAAAPNAGASTARSNAGVTDGGRTAEAGPSSNRKAFKRSTSFDKDLAVLSATYLLQDNPRIKEAIVLINRIREKDDNDMLGSTIAKCAVVCVELARLAEGDPQSAQAAVDDFLRIINVVNDFNYDGEAVEGLRAQASHPSLRFTNQKVLRGLSGPLVAILGSGITILEVLKEASEAIDAVPFLKPIFASVTALLSSAQQTQFNYSQMESLASMAGEFALSLAETCSMLTSVPAEVERLINRQLREVVERCEELNRKPFLWCFLQNSNYKEDLMKLNNDLDAAVKQFQNTNLITLQANVERIVVKMDQMALETLPKHPDVSALLSEYMPESRPFDIEKICIWIQSSTELMFLIYGAAGLGKSTLTHHLSQRFRSAGRLAASIFLSAFPSLDNLGPETVIKTLSAEIGRTHPRAIPKIVEAINDCNGLSLQDHVERFILNPLRSLRYPHSLIIIVDALDEWKAHPIFIKVLALLNSETSVVQFIVTSRLNPCNPRLREFDEIVMETYPLQTVTKDVVKTFLRHHFEYIEWDFGRKPDDHDIEKLAELSDGFLVWAATVCSLLSHQFSEYTPHAILRGILAMEQKVGGSEQLVQLYRNAITRLFPSPVDQKHLQRFLGAIIVLQEALSVYDFSSLAGMPPNLVTKIQSALSALQLRAPPNNESKTMVYPATLLFHQSFLEYVQDTSSTPDKGITISTFDSHSVLGLACLKSLHDFLPMTQELISSFRLHGIRQYAVKFWPAHVAAGTLRSQEQWSQTPHCLTLQQTSIESLKQWATLFLRAVKPEAPSEDFHCDGESTAEVLRALAARIEKGDRGGTPHLEGKCLEVAVRAEGSRDELWEDLGDHYSKMSAKTGGLREYDEAVAAYDHTLTLRPAPHPRRSQALSDLAQALLFRFEQKGDIADLNNGVELHSEALTLRPEPHPGRPDSLEKYANALRLRFDQKGDIPDLVEAISCNRAALALRDVSDEDRSYTLNNLATVLHRCFWYTDDINMLNEAISVHRDLTQI
ncbi:hypothetical protein H1R20_g16339, partial [Candolleomyces eurysporus]